MVGILELCGTLVIGKGLCPGLLGCAVYNSYSRRKREEGCRRIGPSLFRWQLCGYPLAYGG